jgi:glycosyltransferase involved in cell wall biosynthesis
MNPPSKLPVSVCIIAGNEAHRIGPTLQSVADWAAEIVVVINDNVNDGTDKVVESFGGKVFRESWKGFIGQKNSAAEKCASPWLLNLDADEIVTRELRDEIRSLLQDGTPEHGVYEFPRCTFYCGRWIRHGDWYPDRVWRLWRRGVASWSGNEPHARLEFKCTTGRLRSDLQHLSAETINHQVVKTMKYADDFVRQCAANGKQITFLDLLVRPPWRFLRGYVLRLGFLDGWQGFTIAWLTAFYTFLRYVRVRESRLKTTGPQ